MPRSTTVSVRASPQKRHVGNATVISHASSSSGPAGRPYHFTALIGRHLALAFRCASMVTAGPRERHRPISPWRRALRGGTMIAFGDEEIDVRALVTGHKGFIG